MLKVEMHFLADVFITCDACGGKRYDSDTLQVKYRGKSISDVLETTCGEALKFFASIPPIARILQTLCDVGLDYLPLGQPATTLSGGEAQRIKLAAELSQRDSGRSFYILDEPTTGLHFEDVRKLLNVLHRLVDLGNTVVVVEHNLDVVKNADWVVEIGPEAGLEGGRLVFAGTPEQLIEYAVRWRTSSNEQKALLRTYTGEALIPVFSRGVFEERLIQNPETVQEQDADLDEDVEVNDDSSQDISEQPWEIDGRRWHTEFRTTRSGVPCKWEGRVLNAIVEKLEEKTLFAETDWQNRTSVEIRLEDRPNVWFMRAITNEEWLLRLKLRTAKNTFEKGSLARKLALKPLKDVEEIPLYGTLPRVKVEVVGAWQEIELKVFSFSEIDRPEFWDFLELAYERFANSVERPKDLDVDLTPWKTQGRSWHTSPSGFYGAGKALWPLDLLVKAIDVVEGIDKNLEFVWTNKIAVPFQIKGRSMPLGKIYTKNSDFLSIQ
ncbi:MAG: excinuclease ABC subunit A, partial [Thermoguttaceae bacterium]|nr:excinuclease ABC subunit A [Thermoguttaceae bacterium]